MIRSFANKDTGAFFEGKRVKWIQPFAKAASRKLDMLDAAGRVDDLRSRLEALSGDRAGQHSIRINDRRRLCFVWKDDGAHDVEIVDYHR